MGLNPYYIPLFKGAKMVLNRNAKLLQLVHHFFAVKAQVFRQLVHSYFPHLITPKVLPLLIISSLTTPFLILNKLPTLLSYY